MLYILVLHCFFAVFCFFKQTDKINYLSKSAKIGFKSFLCVLKSIIFVIAVVLIKFF